MDTYEVLHSISRTRDTRPVMTAGVIRRLSAAGAADALRTHVGALHSSPRPFPPIYSAHVRLYSPIHPAVSIKEPSSFSRRENLGD
jgi:hypothetical protein